MAELAQERPAVVGEERGQPRGCIEGLRDLEELRRLEAPAAGRALHGRTDVTGRPDPRAGPLLEERPRLVGLVEPARHDDRVVRRLERLGQAARGRERGGLGEPRPDRRELEQGQRAFVHRRPVSPRSPAGRRTAGTSDRRPTDCHAR